KVEALIAWGAQHGASLLEIAIGGLAAQPGCTSVIAGATSPGQVKANAAAGGWEPAPDEPAESEKMVAPPPAGAKKTPQPRPPVAGGSNQAPPRRPDPRGIRYLGRVAALLVAADDADDRALAGGSGQAGQERAAAGPLGVAAAVELKLGGAEALRPVRAQDRLIRVVRVADDLDQRGRRPVGAELFGAGDVLDAGAVARRGHPEEGDIVVRILGGLPGLVGVDAGDLPAAVGLLPVRVSGDERDRPGCSGQAVRGGDGQVTVRAVHDGRRAEVR